MSLKVGLIGFGQMGRNHYRVLQSIQGVNLVAVCDPILSDHSDDAGIAWCSNIERLLDHSLDYVVVATPTRSHYQVALKLIDEGINLLIEKPITESTMQSNDLIARAAQKGTSLLVGHIERFNPALREAKRYISKGAIGKPLALSTTRRGPRPLRVTDADVILDIGIHDLDLSRWALMDEYHNLTSFGVESDTRNFWLASFITGSMVRTNIICSHEISWLSPKKDRQVLFFGHEGSLRVNLLLSELEFHSPADHDLSSQDGPLAHFKGGVEYETKKISLARKEPLVLEHEEVRDYLLGNKEASVVQASDAVKSLALVERVKESQSHYRMKHAES